MSHDKETRRRIHKRMAELFWADLPWVLLLSGLLLGLVLSFMWGHW